MLRKDLHQYIYLISAYSYRALADILPAFVIATVFAGFLWAN